MLKQLNDYKNSILLEYGYKHNLIHPFEDEIIDRLRDKYYGDFPASILVGDKMFTAGKCYERSLLLSYAIDDCFLVTADTKNLELAHGKKMAMHAWVEKDDFVYDTTAGMKVNKRLYYLLNCPSNIMRTSKEMLIKNNDYKDITDYPRNRFAIETIVSTIEAMAQVSGSSFLKSELEIYKSKVDYYTVIKENKNMFEMCLRKML